MNSISVSVGGEKKDGKYDDWFLKNCAEKLLEAEEIKQDAKLMKALKPLLEKKSKAVKSLDDLRQAARNSIDNDGDKD
jgi:hypothetical protein